MLAPAQLYKDELNNKLIGIWYKEKYMYWNNGICYQQVSVAENTWNSHDFVSLNKKREVIGQIKYDINRQAHTVTSLSIINFTGDIVTFGNDLRIAIDEIFTKYGFLKLSYGVIIGNPIEKTYDRLTAKYGGRIVGICEKDVRLMDGNYYDYKMYEMFREAYIEKSAGVKKGV